jgi:hypothetical protein
MTCEEPDYVIETFSKGTLFTHQRFCNEPFGVVCDRTKQECDWRRYRLFWTTPGRKTYFGDDVLKYTLQTMRDLVGISLRTSHSDMLELPGVKDHSLQEYSDPFVNAWYSMLEDNLLGFKVDFINCYNEEIIFSKHGEFLEIVETLPAINADKTFMTSDPIETRQQFVDLGS